MIRISKEDKNFIKTAEDDSQLGEEAAFIITNAKVGCFFRVYSENLMDALNYPHDDVEASLRLFYYCKKVGFGNTENFCTKNSVDWDKFSFVRTLSDKVKPAKVRDPRSCKPCDECACIDLLRMMFARHFLKNACIYAGGTNFLNYNQAILFQISPDSVVHSYSKMWDTHPAVYFRLKQESCGSQYANFLCLVQPMINTELIFSEITDSNILVGKAVGKRVMENSDAAENTIGRFALFCDYDNISSRLSVKHAKHVFGQLKAYIEQQMESVVVETAQLNRRHFWLEESSTLLIIGAGLQVQNLVIGEGATDALLIDLEGKVFQRPIQAYKEFIKDTNSSASSMVLAVGPEHYLLVVLPDVCEAQQLKEEFAKSGKETEYYRFDCGSDFWNFPRSAEYDERAANETCAVCTMLPDEKKFIRLSLCGHILCDDCIIHYLRSVESFPVKCTASECPGTILAADLDILLSHFGLKAREETESTFSLLAKHSLLHFLLTNEKGYRRCLTNNCSGILDPLDGKTGSPISKKNLKNGVVCCMCKKKRCGLCGLDVHSAVDCQQYFRKIYEAENPGIANWKDADPENRRFCPNNDCHAIIEKAAGCNHMQCLRCRKHFCWICEDFQSTTSRKIYAHLEDVHRGNGAEGLQAWEDYME